MNDSPITVAYADPPYLGQGGRYDHPDAKIWNKPKAHTDLVARLCDEYPDGWALSLSSPSLSVILPACPQDCRVSAWVKPFAIFKPNVGVAYAWEPIVWRGGRRRTRQQPTVRDWFSANVTLKKGLVGAKPRGFGFWLFSVLNLREGDTFVDLFPGTGAVSSEWKEWVRPPQKEWTEI